MPRTCIICSDTKIRKNGRVMMRFGEDSCICNRHIPAKPKDLWAILSEYIQDNPGMTSKEIRISFFEKYPWVKAHEFAAVMEQAREAGKLAYCLRLR